MLEDEFSSLTRRERIKKKIKENWKPFALGAGTVVGVIVVAGVIFYVTKGRKVVILGHMRGGDGSLIMYRPVFKKSPVYHVTNQHGAPYNRRGRVIECLETGERTVSITEMANRTGYNRSQINQHLNYPELYPDVNGHHFKSLGYTVFNHGNPELLDV